jgi:hypothetical protein
MDMTMLDVTDTNGLGDVITLLGRDGEDVVTVSEPRRRGLSPTSAHGTPRAPAALIAMLTTPGGGRSVGRHPRARWREWGAAPDAAEYGDEE